MLEHAHREAFQKHRQNAADWLLRAQKATSDGGVCAWYHVKDGYCPTAYPEVTGYVIPTFLDLYHLTGRIRFRNAAIQMADWMTSVQREDGAVTAMDFTTPYVFDTGQDILGWVRAYRETGAVVYLDAAVRAGRWLIKRQHPDGCWWTTPTSGYTHTYHTRVAWSLLRLGDVIEKQAFREAAVRNLDWVVGKQTGSGCFSGSGTSETTHFLAYAARGLLESGLHLKCQTYTRAAQKMADAVLGRLRKDGYLSGAFDASWNEAAASSCLTGNLQFAIVWMLLYRHTGAELYREGALRTLRYTLSTQRDDASDAGIYGAVAGSEPLSGEYCPYLYLSWATKFLVDAIHLFLHPGLALTG